MKNVILLILILNFGSCAIKKDIDRKEKKELTLLKITESFDKKKLNYIGLKKYCNSGIRIEKSNKKDCRNCYSKNEIYIFWNDNEKSYVQKFDNCSEFNIIEISDFNTNEFLKNNTKELQTNKVERYKINQDTYRTQSHSCFRSFILNDGQIKYEKRFDVLNLTGENDNLNYKRNNSLKLIELEKKLNKIIHKLESENQFKRNKKTCHNTVYN